MKKNFSWKDFDWQTATEEEKREARRRNRKFQRNMKLFYLRLEIRNKLLQIFIVPFGKLRKPMKLQYEDMIGMPGDVIYKSPICPKCKETAIYNEDYCIWCGQRFEKEERSKS